MAKKGGKIQEVRQRKDKEIRVMSETTDHDAKCFDKEQNISRKGKSHARSDKSGGFPTVCHITVVDNVALKTFVGQTPQEDIGFVPDSSPNIWLPCIYERCSICQTPVLNLVS